MSEEWKEKTETMREIDIGHQSKLMLFDEGRYWQVHIFDEEQGSQVADLFGMVYDTDEELVHMTKKSIPGVPVDALRAAIAVRRAKRYVESVFS
jgi:hypothetical protein